MKMFIEKNRVLILVLVGVLLVGCLGITFAYFTIGGKQDEFITFKSGTCLSITITEESDAINLESVLPETIEEGLNHTPYTFKIKNNCSTEAPFQISLESLNQVENSLGVEYIQVSLEDSEGRRITDKLGNLDETIISNENAYDARKILNGKLEGNATTFYKLRMWLDYDATKEQAANKTYTSKIVVSAKDSVTVDDEIIKIAYQEEASTPGINEWYKGYTTRVNITDSKDTNIKAKNCVSNTVCEPNTDITLTNNSFTYEYPNGSNVVCTQGYDTKGNSSKITCNDVIKVDNNKPTIEYALGDNIGGTNNWYQDLKVKINGIDNESGISKIKYCTTTSETCEPTNEEDASSAIVTLSSNSLEQKVCAKAIDNNGNESEVSCSSTYKVDNDNPTIIVAVASSTAGSNSWYQALSIKGDASDTTSGITSMKYCTTTSETCTPTAAITNGGSVPLTSNASAQKVCFQASDNTGRTSEVTCSGTYKVDTSTTTTNVNIETSTLGTNNWYQALTIKVQGNNSYSGVSSIKYCTTTSTTCTPSTSATGTQKTIPLSSNTSAQKVCANATDNRGQTSATACSDAYSVDTTKPSINISSTSSTYNSITVNVSGSDSHSGISGYKFSSNNGSSYTTKTSTNGTYSYTFSGLNGSTKYTIAVQSIDKAGNIAEKVTKDVTTPAAVITKDDIIASLSPKTSKPNYSNVATTNEGVYKIADGMYGGYSYVWRGAVSNNWVKFANKYWRIIRINGDGSIRLIYTGNSSLTNVTVDANGVTATGTGTLTTSSKYSSSKDRSEYVGYKWKTKTN